MQAEKILTETSLLNGLKKAIEKRPIESLQVELLISDVVATLEETFDQEVPSEKIGALIMERLKKIDKIAYVRYASVYKDFRDINELAKEVNKLK